MFILGLGTTRSFAAVGCTLNDPDRDIKKIFPQSTGYKTSFLTIKENGGENLQQFIEEKLGDKLEPVYENQDVAYAYYDILKQKEVIGRIHGVNQKGRYGGMQLILATDTDGVILKFYYQKILSPESRLLKDKKFIGQFTGLKLDDFLSGRADVKDPTNKEHDDFNATLRGVKKNLILLYIFKLGGNYEDNL